LFVEVVLLQQCFYTYREFIANKYAFFKSSYTVGLPVKTCCSSKQRFCLVLFVASVEKMLVV